MRTNRILATFASVLTALVALFALMGFVGVQNAAAQDSAPDYQPVVDPYPVTVGVTTTINLEPAPSADALVHWMINDASGVTIYDAEQITATTVFTQPGNYTVGVVVSDTIGVFTGYWNLIVDAPVLSPAEALSNLLTAVMMPAGTERTETVAVAVAEVQRAFNVAIRGAVNSTEGGSIELRPTQPIASLTEEARAMSIAAADSGGTDLRFAWGAGFHNHLSDLGAGTQLLSGVFYDPDDDSAFGTTEPICGGLWISSMYTPEVSLDAGTYTATFTSTQWVDSDLNGQYDLLVLGSPWNGSVATITLTIADTYTETWSVMLGSEPKLISTDGVSPQPAPADAFATSLAADEHPFVPGTGWDVEPSLGLTDTVLFGAYYGGSDIYFVCNDACTVTFNGRTYNATDADNDGHFDVALPGAGDTAVEGPGPWDIVVTNADGVSEHWFFQLGVQPQLIPAAGE